MSENGDMENAMEAEQPAEGEQPAEEEQAAAPKYKNLTEEKLEEIDEIFETFDKDRDGLIGFFDLTNLLRWLSFNPTGSEMEALKN